jgi:hypothetical protein
VAAGVRRPGSGRPPSPTFAAPAPASALPTPPRAGNWRSALQDAQAARKLDPSNVKAAFRAARAAAKLGRLELAGALIDEGLALDPGSAELLKLQQVGCEGVGGCVRMAEGKGVGSAAPQLGEQPGGGGVALVKTRPGPACRPFCRRAQDLAPARKAAEEKARREAEARERVMAPARKLAEALTARGYKLTRPQVRRGRGGRRAGARRRRARLPGARTRSARFGAAARRSGPTAPPAPTARAAQVAVGSRRPTVDADGAIHWPVLLVYPETMQQDVVEDWLDGDSVADHLDVVGGVGVEGGGWVWSGASGWGGRAWWTGPTRTAWRTTWTW